MIFKIHYPFYMSIFCLFCIFVIYFSIFFFTVLSHFCKLIFSFFHFLFFITQYGFFPFIMVIWLQRGVICMKTFFKNLTFTFLCLGISTILAFFFFNIGQKNSVNTALIYISGSDPDRSEYDQLLVWCCRLRFLCHRSKLFFYISLFQTKLHTGRISGHIYRHAGYFSYHQRDRQYAQKTKSHCLRTGTKACRSRARENSCQSSARRITWSAYPSDEHNRLFCLLSGRCPEYVRARTYGADFEY